MAGAVAGVGEAKTGQATPGTEHAPEREGKPEEEGTLRHGEGSTCEDAAVCWRRSLVAAHGPLKVAGVAGTG